MSCIDRLFTSEIIPLENNKDVDRKTGAFFYFCEKFWFIQLAIHKSRGGHFR